LYGDSGQLGWPAPRIGSVILVLPGAVRALSAA